MEENCPKNNCCKKNNWGGKRPFSGRKRTCSNKVSFNRRINENILNILKIFAKKYEITETEALESAILLQNNIDRKKGEIMKIAIPTKDGKLCSHFGQCESFTFAEVNTDTKEILSLDSMVPEEGISCQSASWISEQGTNIVLAGGMGGRPIGIFSQNGVSVVLGCPELEIKTLVQKYLSQNLETGENTCGGEHHHCQHHGEGCHH